MVGLRTELDLDPFDAPVDARIYIDYKNIGQKPIAAVKFRLRFVDDSGNNKGTFQAADGTLVQPGEQGSQKFRENRVYPNVSSVMARVLTVKYLDGQLWESTKATAAPAQ